MHMATKTRPWTRADLERLPDDGNRYEVLDGELFVTPQARFDHQDIATQLAIVIGSYVKEHAIGRVVAPGAVVFGKNELQPDIQVIPGAEQRPAGTDWKELPTPILVVEVLSDSTRHRDLGKKRDAYRRVGIETYWILDPDGQCALVFAPGNDEPTILTDALRWRPQASVPALEIGLDSIFPK